MILLIDTTAEGVGKIVANKIDSSFPQKEYEYIDTTDMKITNCLGCNYCWLKTPGECVIQDDYEPLLKKISKADQVWLISDIKFGFISYQTKNVIDRIMPILTMNLHMVGDQMRHIMRYDKNPNWGLIHTGDGDQENLSVWCERVAKNTASKSLGAYSINDYKEAIKCM